jgi:hypothetical protein
MSPSLAGLIYGTISVAALLAAETARSETYGKTVGAVGIMMVLYWVAHSYAEYTEERVTDHKPFTYKGWMIMATRELTVLIGAGIPLVVLLGCWVFGASLNTAVVAATWTAAGIVVVTELIIGLGADLKGKELVRQTGVGMLLGFMVLALRVLLH